MWLMSLKWGVSILKKKKLNPTLIRGEKNYIFLSSCNYCVNVSKYILKNIHLATSELMVTFLLRKKSVIDYW